MFLTRSVGIFVVVVFVFSRSFRLVTASTDYSTACQEMTQYYETSNNGKCTCSDLSLSSQQLGVKIDTAFISCITQSPKPLQVDANFTGTTQYLSSMTYTPLSGASGTQGLVITLEYDNTGTNIDQHQLQSCLADITNTSTVGDASSSTPACSCRVCNDTTTIATQCGTSVETPCQRPRDLFGYHYVRTTQKTTSFAQQSMHPNRMTVWGTVLVAMASLLVAYL